MVVETERQSKIRKADLDVEQKKAEEKDKKSKNSPFTKWTQVNGSDEAYEAEDWLIAKAPTAYRILRFLVANMDRYNAILCSYKVMQERFGYSRATLSEAIKILKKHKYLDVKKSGTSNVYLINKELYWNSWGSNYAYAEFGVKVILSASEQDEDTQEEIKLQIKKRQEVIIREQKNAADKSDAAKSN